MTPIPPHSFLLAAFFYYVVSALGITAGAHRLWSHRTYKARLPLRFFLIVANTMAFQVRSRLLSALFSTLLMVWGWDGEQHLKRSNTWTTISLSSLLEVTSSSGPVLPSIRHEHASESLEKGDRKYSLCLGLYFILRSLCYHTVWLLGSFILKRHNA